MATAIGVVSGIITIFSFLADTLPQQESPKTKFTFYIGLNGAGNPGLSNAGGNPPDVRVWDERGGFLGITTNDNGYCVDGSIVCETEVNDVQRQPTYALFSANDDAICISWAGTTWPNGYKYANTIGNWAETCATRYGVGQATWYFSDVFVKREDGGSENVKCGWIDSNGDQPSTGIQIHWPDFDAAGPRNDPSFYCNYNPTLSWRTENDPSSVFLPGKKRDALSSRAAVEEEMAELKAREAGALQQRNLADRFADTLVKSLIPGQSANYICGAAGSAGPSFVSYEDRSFCHMATKTAYPFCDDVSSGLCWQDDLNLVVPKLVDIPVSLGLNFTKLIVWPTQ